jgi:AraC family transcriptional activator of pobA
MKKRAAVQKLHPMDAFGNIHATNGEIRVERLEKRLAPKVPFPHRHDFYHFVYLEKGSGWHEVDFVRHEAAAGQLYSVLPGQVHAWDFGVSTKGFVLEFTKESLRDGASLLHAIGQLPALFPEHLSSLPYFAMMFQEFTEAKPGYRASLEHLLCAFLIQLNRHSSTVARPVAKGLVEKFRSLVDAHFREQHAVEFYAEKLGVKAKALTTKLSAALGKSAGAVIQERCLIEAKRLLAYSDLPVSEVGYEVGFEDPNYFARFFRQRAGMAPGKFRQLAQHSVPA